MNFKYEETKRYDHFSGWTQEIIMIGRDTESLHVMEMMLSIMMIVMILWREAAAASDIKTWISPKRMMVMTTMMMIMSIMMIIRREELRTAGHDFFFNSIHFRSPLRKLKRNIIRRNKRNLWRWRKGDEEEKEERGASSHHQKNIEYQPLVTLLKWLTQTDRHEY